jgi:hypothetical protein
MSKLTADATVQPMHVTACAAALDFARQYLPAGNTFLSSAEWDLRYYLT